MSPTVLTYLNIQIILLPLAEISRYLHKKNTGRHRMEKGSIVNANNADSIEPFKRLSDTLSKWIFAGGHWL